MRHHTIGSYPVEPDQEYREWRQLHFTASGESKSDGTVFDESRLQNMFWFRQQRYQKPVKAAQRMEFARA